MFDDVDLRLIQGIVVQQNFDGLSSDVDETADAPCWQQVGQATLRAEIVARLFVGKHHTGGGRTARDRFKTVFWIQKNRTSIGSQGFGNRSFEYKYVCCRSCAVYTP